MTVKIASEESGWRRCAAAWIAAMTLLPLSGCVPAWQVQRAQEPRACEVRVCIDPGAGSERCACHSHERMRVVLGNA